MTQEVVEQIEALVRDVMNNSLHTAMPGKILEYHDNGLVDVQPIGSFYCGRIEMDYPVVPGVPLCITANQDGMAACIPVKPGDVVLLICTEQSLSALLTGTSEAQSNEKFELTNCVAIPGLMKAPVPAQQEANERNAIVLQNGESKLVVTGDDIEASGNLIVGGDLKVTGNAEIIGNFDVYGNTGLHGGVTFGGTVSIEGGLLVHGDISASGNISGANTEG